MIIAFVLFVVVGSYIGIKKDVSATDKEAAIEVQVRTSLPIGTGLNDALSYLDRNKIAHMDLDRKTNDLIAIFPNIEKGMFVTCDIQVVLHFDKSDKLAACSFKEMTNGL